MSKMGKYCKAYTLSDLKKYSDWKIKNKHVDKEGQQKTVEFGDDDVVFLQENYCVTSDIFVDQAIIFDEVTDTWKEFCEKELDFQIPDYVKQQEGNEQLH